MKKRVFDIAIIVTIIVSIFLGGKTIYGLSKSIEVKNSVMNIQSDSMFTFMETYQKNIADTAMNNTLNKIFYPYLVSFIISLLITIGLIVIKKIKGKGKMNLKEEKLKIVGICAIVVVIVIAGIAFAVSHSNNESNNNQSQTINTGKGSRNDPYKIGDVIELKDISPVYPYGSLSGQKFDLKFKVNKIYSEAEGLKIRKSKYDTYTTLPIANVTFTLTGNYLDKIYYNEAFSVQSINEDMEGPAGFDFQNDNQENISYIYTGKEYTLNILGKYDMSNRKADKIKYIVLNYADKDGNQNSLYIDFNS